MGLGYPGWYGTRSAPNQQFLYSEGQLLWIKARMKLKYNSQQLKLSISQTLVDALLKTAATGAPSSPFPTIYTHMATSDPGLFPTPHQLQLYGSIIRLGINH